MIRSDSFTGLVLLALLLTGCTASKQDRAVAACREAIAERLEGKSWTVVDAELKRGYRAVDAEFSEIGAPVYFEKGLPSETRQTFSCRLRFDPAQSEPAVVGLVFQW